MAVTSFAPAAAGLQPYEQRFTTSGTWTKPAGVKTCDITVVGGAGGGLAAGACVVKRNVDVSAVATVPITVGAGGTTYSVSGGTSSFGTYAAAAGSTGVANGSTGTSTPQELDTTAFGPAGMVNLGSLGASWSNWGSSRVVVSFEDTGRIFAFGRDGSSTTFINTFNSSGVNATLNWPSAQNSNQTMNNVAYRNGVYVVSGDVNGTLYYVNSNFTSGATLTAVSVSGTSPIEGRITANANYFFAVSQDLKVWRSADGASWTQAGTVSGLSANTLANKGIVCDSSGRLIVADYASYVSISSDNGATWTYTGQRVNTNWSSSYSSYPQQLFVANNGYLYATFYNETSSSVGRFTATNNSVSATFGIMSTSHTSGYDKSNFNQIGKEPLFAFGAFYNSSWRTWLFDDRSLIATSTQITGTNSIGLPNETDSICIGGLNNFVVMATGVQSANGGGMVRITGYRAIGPKFYGAGGTVTPGAGGHALSNTYTNIPGPGVDGFGAGASSLSSIDGTMKPNYGCAGTVKGGDGIVIVRWWA